MGIRETIRAFILDNFYVSEPEGLADDASLIERGVVDSTGIMEVIWFIEEQYRIKVGDKEAVPANLETIGRISAFVARKLEGQSSQGRDTEPVAPLGVRAAS